MNTLTIYTPDYDSKENIVNNGMSGKAFLDMDNRIGTPFPDMDKALEYIVENNITIDRIEFNYLSEDTQMFKKFNVSRE